MRSKREASLVSTVVFREDPPLAGAGTRLFGNWRTEDPREVLFGQDAGGPPEFNDEAPVCGFYWTEGTRGLGWAEDAVPTLKGGSTAT